MSSDGGLRPLFATRLRVGFHWQSIETGMTGKGIPDSNYCSGGKEGWVEMKWTDGWAVTLLPEQIGWLSRRHRAGGRVFVAVRRLCTAGPRRLAADELWLCRGSFAPDLRSMGLNPPPSGAVIGQWTGGPERWDWDAVRRALLSKSQK